jgi:hypothetical protein
MINGELEAASAVTIFLVESEDKLDYRISNLKKPKVEDEEIKEIFDFEKK